MAKLVVHRDSPRDVKMRFIQIIVDGKISGQLSFGESTTIDIEPGERRIRFDNTWAKKDFTLDFTDGQTRTFVVGNVPGGCFLASLALAGASPTPVFAEEITE
jgi:hypothetical protein